MYGCVRWFGLLWSTVLVQHTVPNEFSAAAVILVADEIEKHLVS